MRDILPSARSTSRLFEIRAAGDMSPLLALEHIDTVVIADADGAQELCRADVNTDSLRLHPKLQKTTRQIIQSANMQWALSEHDSYGADNG